MKGPLSPHLRPRYLPPERRKPLSSETIPQETRKEKAQKVHGWRRWRLRKKYPWSSFVFLVSALASLYLAYTEAPVYRAEATLLIEPSADHSLAGYRPIDRNVSSPVAHDDKTQYELLKNHSLVSRVIREQDLDSTSILSEEQTRGQQPVTTDPASNAAEVTVHAIEAYLTNLDIVPIPETRLVKVAYRAADPQLAARIANAHVEAYIRQNKELGQSNQGQAANVTWVDTAIPPLKPTSTRRRSLFIVGGLLGLLLGGGYSMAQDALSLLYGRLPMSHAI